MKRQGKKFLKKTIFLLLLCLAVTFPCACMQQGNIASEEDVPREQALSWSDMQPEESMELHYAAEFTVDMYEGGYALVSIADTGRYLVVPEQSEVPENLEEDIVVLKQPLDHIYLVSTSVMDLFRVVGGIENIRLTGTKEQDWYIDEIRQAMERGDIIYAGKYSAPDYELIVSEGCKLAIENTMIYHTPEVKEQLEQLGIPVLVERSSYETHPLGRMEWIKLYGLLLNKRQEAEAYYEEQLAQISDILEQESTGKTVAFFYVNANGAVNVRETGDYVTKMIELAGGRYVPAELPEDNNALSTLNIQMEAFYAGAKDADYLIYNSAIDGELTAISELVEKNELFSDFKAVREGNVWCTGKNMFQESTGIGDMILELHHIITNEAEDEMTYIHRLK